MATAPTTHPNTPNGLFHTERQDTWWIEPVLTTLALVAFVIYATWRAFENANYEWGPYISPFYSPNFKEIFPAIFSWLPWLASWSPALFVVWMPSFFRFTCYFYRRAYYRAFFWDPPACAVGEPTARKNYKGETALFVFNNLHRYALYLALILTVFHWFHAVHAFSFQGSFGVGVGSLVILLDAVLLTLYVFSCHSLRHLIGGKLNCFSQNAITQACHSAWKCQSKLNNHHMFYAWSSLFTVGFTDLYIRMVASGAWTDFRLF